MNRLSENLYSWASILDDQALAQAEISAKMPFIYPHVALMPDAHPGMGATVGSVIPTVDAIMPAAVGVDIGCGMLAVRTQFTESELRGRRRSLAYLREQIERVIPLSPGRENRKEWGSAPAAIDQLRQQARAHDIKPEEFSDHWHRQLGSLGGGNHFIEVVADDAAMVWAFLHSGSRGVGNRIARSFISAAQLLARQQSRELPHRDLAYFSRGDRQFEEYLAHLNWAQEYARLNRRVMMDRITDQITRFMDVPVTPLETIDCHHNYTTSEEHYGQQVLISRKGAIAAHLGTRGLIPGSMGTASYVVTGRGNQESLCSAPHGAGREYSRSRARATFTQADLRDRMRGIEYRDLPAFVDEIPDAYKDVDTVMADAADLVDIDRVFRQLINVKGQ